MKAIQKNNKKIWLLFSLSFLFLLTSISLEIFSFFSLNLKGWNSLFGLGIISTYLVGVVFNFYLKNMVLGNKKERNNTKSKNLIEGNSTILFNKAFWNKFFKSFEYFWEILITSITLYFVLEAINQKWLNDFKSFLYYFFSFYIIFFLFFSLFKFIELIIIFLIIRKKIYKKNVPFLKVQFLIWAQLFLVFIWYVFVIAWIINIIFWVLSIKTIFSFIFLIIIFISSIFIKITYKNKNSIKSFIKDLK